MCILQTYMPVSWTNYTVHFCYWSPQATNCVVQKTEQTLSFSQFIESSFNLQQTSPQVFHKLIGRSRDAGVWTEDQRCFIVPEPR